ncbi:hypothetical protein F4802DRAFT_547371 [Xylaria palmicola]|nr:hypothetical protein F4802DRAFT_547371 [Xylaria palmicola]
MATPTFHCFSRLPPELRLLIWEECAQKPEPGAQFFTIYPREYTSDDMKLLEGKLADFNGLGPGDAGRLAAPRGHRTGEFSWRRDNKSAYMIDYGLWTACWESRVAMLKLYKAQGRTWLQPGYHRHPSPPHRSCEDTLSGSFREDDRSYYFTINPGRDLLCLQILRAEMGSILTIVAGAPVFGPHSPFADFGLSAPLGTAGAQHIAQELDPAWLTITNEDTMEREAWDGLMWESNHFLRVMSSLNCATMMVEAVMSGDRMLWFIDYRIHLQPGATCPKGPDRYVFAGLGCKFVEAQAGDDVWEIRDDSDAGKKDTLAVSHPRPSLRGHFSFLHQLSNTRLCDGHVQANSFVCPICHRTGLGILACVLEN